MPNPIEYRVYYDSTGKVITYTTEDIPGDYIIVTAEQYAEARSDALVFNGKLVLPHKVKVVSKLIRNLDRGVSTSKYDINVITDIDSTKWELIQNVVKR